MLCAGANAPALYNDAVIVEALRGIGYSLEDARDYAVCGCVEPVAPGKTFGSTDAALFNLPIVLELALNEGRRFGTRSRTGARTPHPTRLRSMEDVTAAFETQLAFQVGQAGPRPARRGARPSHVPSDAAHQHAARGLRRARHLLDGGRRALQWLGHPVRRRRATPATASTPSSASSSRSSA